MSGLDSDRFVAPTHETILKLLECRGSTMRLWMALALKVKWWDDPQGRWRAGETWPSWEYIRETYSLSNDSIRTGLEELVKCGLLDMIVPARGSTHYFLKGYATFGRPSAAVDPGPGHGRPGSAAAAERAPAGAATVSAVDHSENRSGGSTPKIGVDHSENRSAGPSGDHSENRSGTTKNKLPEINKGEAPGSSAAPDPTARDLRHAARRAGLVGSRRQVRDLVRALMLRLGPRRALAFLELPETAGRDPLKLDRQIEDFKQRTSAGGPKPPDPGCPNCGGGGKRASTSSGFETACKCTWAEG